jgi:hypothetical protein
VAVQRARFGVLVTAWMLLAILAPAQETPQQKPGNLAVDADIPGGNVILEKIDGDTVFVRQDLRDTAGDWFYWHFRVRGAAGRTLTFRFTKGNVLGVRGPAVSPDGGKTWSWLGAAACQGAAFRYEFPTGADDVRFSFTIPYFESHLNEFLSKHGKSPALKAETLCRTKKGRDVELLRVGRLGGEPDHRVVLTARHHCCESMAGYVMEGILDAALDPAGDGPWYREHVEILAVPFMDKDGVEDGDQGKNRKPHDHNRDYVQELYPSVKSLKERIPAWSQGKLRIALDLHCPWIRGPRNEVIYFVGGPDAAIWERVTQFAKILASVQSGPLVYKEGDNLPYGVDWNKGPDDPSLKSFGRWAAELPGIRVASTIETPYANAGGKDVTPDSARAFGRDVARAIRKYLEPQMDTDGRRGD